MISINTPRLKLLALDHEHIELLLVNRRHLEIKLGLVLSNMIISPKMQAELDDALLYWRVMTKEYSEDYAWFTNWEIILLAENKSIGGIGLSGLPNKDGIVGTGYVIDATYHGQGYATEALTALKYWVFENKKVKAMEAETPKNNIPSQKVLLNNGFEQIGEKDGNLVWQFIATVH